MAISGINVDNITSCSVSGVSIKVSKCILMDSAQIGTDRHRLIYTETCSGPYVGLDASA